MSRTIARTNGAFRTSSASRTAHALHCPSAVLLAVIGAALVACSDGPTVPRSRAAVAPAFAKGPFEGPKSVPTRGRILFQSRITGDAELYSMLEDGTSIVRLTHSAGEDGPGEFSPDARKIAFVSERDGTSQLYVMNSDGSGIKRVTNLEGGSAAVGRPSWSPDGKSLALAIWTDAANQEDIFVISANGGAVPTPIASGAARDLEPAFSPDGARLAFTSDRSGNEEVWIMNANGSDPTKLTSCGDRCLNPAWSPDGTRIAFTLALTDQSFTSVNVVGVAAKNFVLGVSGVSLPVWAPDGVKLAVNYNVNGENEIATMNANGSDLHMITSFGINGAQASSWSR